MEIFILLHAEVYEKADGKIIACSLFRENLIDKMNRMAKEANDEVMKYAGLYDTPRSRLYIYNETKECWARWNGKNWIEKLCIERFDMI